MRIGASRARSSNYRIILHWGFHQLRLLVLRHSKHGLDEVVVNDTVELSSHSIPSALKSFQSDYHKLGLKDCPVELVLGLGHYQAVSIDRPNVPDEDISASLTFQLGELVDLPPEQMVTDYYELPYQPSGQNKIVAIAANKATLKEWVDAITANDWSLQCISIVELQLGQLHEPSNKALMAVYPLSEQGYLAQIYHAGKLCFSRTLRGVKAIDDYSKEEIELGALEPMATELQRSMDYYESQLRQAPVKSVSLAIAHPQMNAVSTALAELLAVDVSVYQYPQWMSELCEGDFTDLEAFAAATQQGGPNEANG